MIASPIMLIQQKKDRLIRDISPLALITVDPKNTDTAFNKPRILSGHIPVYSQRG